MFAVFEIIGDEVSQITVWLPLEPAQKYLADWRKRYPDETYVIFQRHDY